jgi:hypothetical protein
MAYKVDFVGLVCFFAQGDRRTALAPDGRDPGPGVAPHRARLIIESAQFMSATDWPSTDDGEIMTFAIDAPVVLSISGADGAGVNAAQHDELTPRLSSDRSLQVDLANAETIFRLTIGAGTLRAFQLELGVISQWEVTDHQGEVTITAGARSLTVREGTEIVLANLSDDPTGGSATEEAAHFQIYKKLAPGQTGTVSQPDPDFDQLPELESSHPFMQPTVTEFPGRNCSNVAAS